MGMITSIKRAFTRSAMTHPAVVNHQAVQQMKVLPITPSISRFFKASETGRLESDWITQNASADKELRYNLDVLRARSRDLTRNDPYIKKFMKLLKVNVVGQHGIRLSAKFEDETGQLDTRDIAAVQESWHEWGQQGNCTVCRQYNFADLLDEIITSVARDGEILIRLWPGFANTHRFALQLLEVDHLKTTYNTVLDNGNIVKMGIEQNKYGEPVAYYLHKSHPGNDPISTYNINELVRVPAEEIIHLFIKDRPSQSRGIPWISASAPNLKHLNKFLYSEVVASEGAANAWGVLTKEASSGAEYKGDTGTDQIQMEHAPAMIYQLPEGIDYKPLTPAHPNTSVNEFVKGVLRGVAAGLGVGYSSLASDRESINFSSLRGETLEDRDMYREIQQWLIDTFLTPLYKRWIRVYGMVNNIPDWRIQTKFQKVVWRPRTWAWVDPQKDMNANVLALNNRLTTRTAILEERGHDFIELCQELKREKEIMQQYGLTDDDIMEAVDGQANK